MAKTVFAFVMLLALGVPEAAGQHSVSSTATAEGAEGLFLNPAAVAVHNHRLAGVGATYSGNGDLEAGIGLLDTFYLQYTNTSGAENLSVHLGFAFEVLEGLSIGYATHADLLPLPQDGFDVSVGALYTPFPSVRVGAAGHRLMNDGLRSISVGLGLRPLTDRITLFGDVLVPGDLISGLSQTPNFDLSRLDYRLGIKTELFDGIEISFGALDRLTTFLVDIRLHFDRFTVGTSLGGSYDLSEYHVTTNTAFHDRRLRSVFDREAETYELVLREPIVGAAQTGSRLSNLETLVSEIRRLADDTRCTRLLVKFDTTAISSFDVLEELSDAFDYFTSRDKQIVSYLANSNSQLDFLAAARGSRVVAAPAAFINLVGVGGEFLFYKGLLEQAGVEVDYARSGEYKSFLDQYLREDLSAENRQQFTDFLVSRYDLIAEILSAGRNISEADVRTVVDGGPYFSTEAQANGLIDAALYEDEFDEQYATESTVLEHEAYADRSWKKTSTIAVLTASGTIANGRDVTPADYLLGGAYITDKTLIPTIERLRDDERVAAVILYVDSPGGDGIVSDMIWKKLRELKERKPLVSVMGATAASGGYYLAMAGAPLFTHRTTLTGSIGGFSYKFVIKRLLDNYGITSDSIAFGENYTMSSPFSLMTDKQRERLSALNDAFVGIFYERVAESRSLPVDRVKEIGGGRIYSGDRAVELGLADRIGGIYDALRYLEGELGLSPWDYELLYYPDRQSLAALLVEELLGGLIPPAAADGVLR